MPNWKLSDRIRQVINNRANARMDTCVELARMNFPLTVAQIQEGAAGLSHAELAAFQVLRDANIDSVVTYRELRLALLRDIIPELRRSVVLYIQLPKYIFVGNARRFGVTTPNFSLVDNDYITPTLENLTPDERTRFTAWVNNLVRQVRMQEVTIACLQNTLLDHDRTPTAAHLRACWPTLCTLPDPTLGDYHSQREHVQMWVERFRNLPRRDLGKYQPDPTFLATWKPLMQVADVMLTQGEMLKDASAHEDGRKVPLAWVEHWERLPNDIVFPLAPAAQA